MPVDNIIISNICFEEDYLHLEGGYYIDSITVFSGYSYRIENNNLYIKMRKAAGSFWHPTDSFNIKINTKGKDISEVYLEDNKGNTELFFPKSNKNGNKCLANDKFSKSDKIIVTSYYNIFYTSVFQFIEYYRSSNTKHFPI